MLFIQLMGPVIHKMPVKAPRSLSERPPEEKR